MASEEKCFTFTWNLENISYCLQARDTAIESPAFVVNSIDKTEWKLVLFPRGDENADYISFYLFRNTDSPHIVHEKIKYELTFVAEDGSALTHWTAVKCDFFGHPGNGFPLFAKRADVFITKRSEFLPHGTLKTRCRIWKTVGEMTEDVHCFARTRIAVHKRAFMWSVKNFSTLESDKKFTYQMKSIEDDTPLMSVDLFLMGGLNCDEIIVFEMFLLDQTINSFTLRLFLVDACGNRIDCNQEEFWIDDPSKSKQFIFFFTKNKLMAMKSSYLSDDILSLHWEWSFSKGIISEEIEDVQYAFTRSKSKLSNARNVQSQKMVSLPYTLNNNLKSFYDENFLCDVKLKTNTRMFNAHKVILSASSSVFKAMFSYDVKEKDSNCVNIDDLNDDTLSRMLVYIYTACIEDLTWERASLLYIAADKYAIFSLKNICSSYMMDNLFPSNACEVLLLSDLHADSDLKYAVQDYILKHIKDVVMSDEWKLLMEANAKLAAETVCLQYK